MDRCVVDRSIGRSVTLCHSVRSSVGHLVPSHCRLLGWSVNQSFGLSVNQSLGRLIAWSVGQSVALSATQLLTHSFAEALVRSLFVTHLVGVSVGRSLGLLLSLTVR